MRRTQRTVTDVGSTKRPVSAAAGGDPRFVGGHPICGAETRGPERATRRALRRRDVVPDPDGGDRARAAPARPRVRRPALGARPVAIGPDAHDRLVAVTSHLPHVLANVLLNQAGSARIDGHDPLQAAGGSLRDMTRIGGANPRIWVDIFLDNREALAAALAEQRRLLEQVEAALAGATRASSPAGSARRAGTGAGCSRRRSSTRARSTGVRIHIPDRPGVLAGIFQALGAERINVEDFELDHVSAERGGTLTMLVSGEGEADAGGAAPRGAGLRRRRRAGDRCVSARRPRIERSSSSRCRGSSGTSPSRATSRSRTAPCSSARSATARRGSPASAARPTPSRRSPPSARSGSTCTSTARTRCACSGRASGGPTAPETPIDCGNAGTLVRLLAGILAGQPARSSSSRATSRSRARPMGRIAEPLGRMGAQVETTDGHLPMTRPRAQPPRHRLRASGRERAGEVGDPPRRPLRRRARRRSSSPRRRATTPSGCSPRPARR